MKKHLLLSFVGAFGCLFTAVNPLSAQIWTQTSAPTNAWSSVASSADGSKLVAAVNGGGIYTSTNSGATWTLTGAPNGPYWHCVASSADGTKLAAAPNEISGAVYISTDSGTTWSDCSGGMVFPAMPIYDSPHGYAVCLSADGTKLAVAENVYDINSNAFDYGLIYTSTNSGATWSLGFESGSSQYWSSIACSADGSKLVAAANGGGIYTSTNSGATWVLTSAPNWPPWKCVASSADGTKLAAAPDVQQGPVYFSTDSGATWNYCNGGMIFPVMPIPDSPFGYAACLSADGMKLVVAENVYNWWFDTFDYGLIYTSANSGAAWGSGYQSGFSQYWSSVASSADGSKLVAAAYGGRIYTSQSAPSPFLNITPSNNGLALSWILPSTNFVLQRSSDLTTMNWVNVTNSPALNLANLRNQMALPLPAGNAFYRLKTP